MISVLLGPDGEPAECIAEVRGRYSVYLDTDTLQELAKGSEERRGRFIAALHKRATLLFSEANAAEVGRLTGRSAERAASFQRQVGPYWAPLEMNAFGLLMRQQRGEVPMGPVSHWFMKGFVQRRHLELSDSKSLPPTTPPEAFAAAFFDLGAVVEWSRDDDGTRKESLAALDQSVRDAVARGRAFYEADATSLDRAFPSIPYAPEKRLQIVLSHLRRTLILEAKGRQIAKNDGIDLSHATMAATYASIAALDKAWKRRVMLLPQPAQLAQVFYRLEVDDLVSLLEGVVEQPPPPPA